MKSRRIYKWADIWEDIEDDSTHTLLLGNGASRAVSDSFAYDSLYQEAYKAGRMDKRTKNLFEEFNTTDFEFILKLLWETHQVNRILRIKEDMTSDIYTAIRQTLMDTITDIHPDHQEVESSLLKIADFLKQFDTVFSLNYDLIVYWSMLAGNDKYGLWFKDCFIDEGRFEPDFNFLYKPYQAEGATLVFYPHGNLILAEDITGDEIKLSKLDERYLLETVISEWEREDYLPLFVSEGTTAEKLRTIRQSPYLDIIYHYVLEDYRDSLVIYGWSVRDEDDHILRALVNGGFQKVAISVHSRDSDATAFCDRVEYKFRNIHHKLHKTYKYRIKFFESDSSGCWTS